MVCAGSLPTTWDVPDTANVTILPQGNGTELCGQVGEAHTAKLAPLGMTWHGSALSHHGLAALMQSAVWKVAKLAGPCFWVSSLMWRIQPDYT